MFETPSLPFSIGPPVWGCEHWAGKVYPEGTAKKDFLRWYARTFNVVEGNSTFYGLPSDDTLHRWVDETPDGFEFCLKFPRVISHEAMLENCETDTQFFLDRLAILDRGRRLGPTFLQLGPDFAPERLTSLQRFLESLPEDYPWAVEVRHPGWFDAGAAPGDGECDAGVSIGAGGGFEDRLDELLRRLRIDKVLFDSRALFQSTPDDEIEIRSQSRKPNPPHRETVTANRPMIRMVGRNRVELARPHVRRWAPVVADWIARGLRPIIFTHAPDDRMAPDFARMWMEELSSRFPGDELALPTPPPNRQPTLF